jgi:hypothetical protein
MPQPIKVDNHRPATVRDVARILGVSKKRTDELIRRVRRMIYRDSRTGEIVIRRKLGKASESGSSSSASRKINKRLRQR